MKKYFAEVFQVTETCNDGKERTIKKTVYVSRFKQSATGSVFFTDEERIYLAEQLLKEQHYYNISHLKSVVSDVLII